MRKMFSVLSIAGLFIFNGTFVTHAAPMEIMPVSYTFDKATDTGWYDYSDWGGVQLTDGQYGDEENWHANLGNGPAYEWVGWVHDTPVNIDFDLGSAVEISQISIGTIQNHPGNVVLPSVNLYSSADGEEWILFDNYFVPESASNNYAHQTYNFTNISVNSQFFRVSLYHSYNGPWTFTDEIDFYTDSAAPVPEPSAILLISVSLAGAGIAGSMKKRRERKKKKSKAPHATV